MDLSVRDSARLLRVSEKTIYRWVKQGTLPAYRVNEQYRFNRAELLEWATSRRINVSAEIFEEPDHHHPAVTLVDALETGGIHYRVAGRDKGEVLRAVVQLMHLPAEVDRQFLLQVLLARESLGSTGIGNGIAIPHVRNPIVMHIPRPMITLCFLDEGIEFDAIDGQPVHTLFAIVSPSTKAHLTLLSRLTFALQQRDFAAAIRQRAARQAILDALARAESNVAPREGGP